VGGEFSWTLGLEVAAMVIAAEEAGGGTSKRQ
jgi:hypothetical protein